MATPVISNIDNTNHTYTATENGVVKNYALNPTSNLFEEAKAPVTPAVPQYNVSTTTVSNQNKINQIPGMLNQVNQYSQRGQITDPNGNVANRDGSIVPPYEEPQVPNGSQPIYGVVGGVPNRIIGYQTPNYATGGVDKTLFNETKYSPEEQAQIDILDQMKATTDANTAALVESIKQKFAVRKTQQERINQAQEAGQRAVLLQSGRGGEGSSAQYAPLSSDSIMTARLSYGVQQLAELDQQEADLVLQAKMAGDNQNFKLLEKKLSMLDEKRAEKAKIAEQINKDLVEQNKKAREQLIQSSRDNAIANLYSQGITDPSEILNYLNANGGNITSKEVADTLKNIVPPGLDDLIKTVRNNGAPGELISSIVNSSSLADAYKVAGQYAAGGTGIVGEYNFYRAQAEAAGQTPVDFNTYQNMDANRKIAVAKATSGGTVTTVNGNGKVTTVNLKPLNENQSRDFTYATRAKQASPTIDELSADVVKMNPFTYATQKTLESTGLGGQKVDDKVRQVRQAERNFLTAILRRESGAQISAEEMKTGEKQYFPLPGDDPSTLAQKKAARETAIKTIAANVPQYEERVKSVGLEDTNKSLMKSETEAKDAINKLFPSLPDTVRGALKTLYEADYTEAQVYEYLKAKGYF